MDEHLANAEQDCSITNIQRHRHTDEKTNLSFCSMIIKTYLDEWRKTGERRKGE